MSAVCPKCNGRDFDYLASECLDCADAKRLAELEATVRLLEAENARLKTCLGQHRGIPATDNPDVVEEALRRSLRDALLESDRLKTELGAASFIASERTRNSIVRYLRDSTIAHSRSPEKEPRWAAAADIEACADINPP